MGDSEFRFVPRLNLMFSHQFGDGVLAALGALADQFTMHSWTAVILVARKRVNAFDFG